MSESFQSHRSIWLIKREREKEREKTIILELNTELILKIEEKEIRIIATNFVRHYIINSVFKTIPSEHQGTLGAEKPSLSLTLEV